MGRPKNTASSDALPKPKVRKRPPAQTLEARENELVSIAYDLVEQRLLAGTATSQETTHFLKIGSTKDRLEKELLETQIKLSAAKTEAIESAKRVEELYTNAINALRQYSGNGAVVEGKEE